MYFCPSATASLPTISTGTSTPKTASPPADPAETSGHSGAIARSAYSCCIRMCDCMCHTLVCPGSHLSRRGLSTTRTGLEPESTPIFRSRAASSVWALKRYCGGVAATESDIRCGRARLCAECHWAMARRVSHRHNSWLVPLSGLDTRSKALQETFVRSTFAISQCELRMGPVAGRHVTTTGGAKHKDSMSASVDLITLRLPCRAIPQLSGV